ncbi:hypothetical protein, partial [Nonomuraea dietziae]|uniref:hypothetical protein n=1 Tax=Nonomuraea dietziae TaxID=65515 RepID=UPI0033FCCBA4
MPREEYASSAATAATVAGRARGRADGQADLDTGQHGAKLRAVAGLARGQDEGQRTAAPVGDRGTLLVSLRRPRQRRRPIRSRPAFAAVFAGSAVLGVLPFDAAPFLFGGLLQRLDQLAVQVHPPRRGGGRGRGGVHAYQVKVGLPASLGLCDHGLPYSSEVSNISSVCQALRKRTFLNASYGLNRGKEQH